MSLVTTILRYFVPRSLVSAITQTPASGPFELVTMPPILSASTETPLMPACADSLRGFAWVRTMAEAIASPDNNSPIPKALFILLSRIESLLNAIIMTCPPGFPVHEIPE